jgi:hypothetical protein
MGKTCSTHGEMENINNFYLHQDNKSFIALIIEEVSSSETAVSTYFYYYYYYYYYYY